MNLGAACPSGTRASRPQRTKGPGPEARLIVHAGGTPASAGRAAPRTRRSRGSGITEVNRRSADGGRIFVVLSKTSRIRGHLSIGEDDFRNTKTVIGLGDLRQERVRVRRSATSTAPAWAVGTWPVGWEGRHPEAATIMESAVGSMRCPDLQPSRTVEDESDADPVPRMVVRSISQPLYSDLRTGPGHGRCST